MATYFACIHWRVQLRMGQYQRYPDAQTWEELQQSCGAYSTLRKFLGYTKQTKLETSVQQVLRDIERKAP